MFRHVEIVIAAALVVAAACGGAAPPAARATPIATPAATPAQPTITVLASGKVDSLPTGALFVNYLDLPQAAGGSIKHQHGAGFVYTVSGMHQLDSDGVPSLMLHAEGAAFVGANVMHTHMNPGTTPNDWWFIAVRPAASRPLPTIVPGQKELYTTGDLTQIPAGSYTETLSDSRLVANGIDRPTGPSLRVLYVIEGALTVSGDAAMTGTVSTGQGAYSLPDANLVLTAGPTGARYVTFTLTPAR